MTGDAISAGAADIRNQSTTVGNRLITTDTQATEIIVEGRTAPTTSRNQCTSVG